LRYSFDKYRLIDTGLLASTTKRATFFQLDLIVHYFQQTKRTNWDTVTTASTLIKVNLDSHTYPNPKLVRQTFDGDTGQVGPELAEMLGVPLVAYVNRIEEMSDGQMRVQRMIDEGHEVIQAPLPAVITAIKDINVPRLPSLRGIAKSESAVIPVWNSQELGADPARVGLSGSFTRVIKVFFPERT
ncbi:unnamed protein product, partial [marine sediment metagenome]